MARKGNVISHHQIPLPLLKESYEQRCREIITEALRVCEGNKTQAAKILGVKRTTLLVWLRRNMPCSLGPSRKKSFN